MPTKYMNEPALLIHNNVAIYTAYEYGDGLSPYTYQFCHTPNGERFDDDTFDIRELSTYDKSLSITENLLKAIEEKALPLFHLSEEEQLEYMVIPKLGYYEMTNEEETALELIDFVLCELFNTDNEIAFRMVTPLSGGRTLFFLPHDDENFFNYDIHVFDGSVNWFQFANKEIEPFMKFHTDNIQNDVNKLVFHALDIPFPCKKEDRFILDDEVQICQDELNEMIDVYIWAADYLVDRLSLQEFGMLLSKDEEMIDNINFYGLYNVKDNSVEINGTYYTYENEEEVQKEFELTLFNSEKVQLIEAIAEYCQKNYHKTPLELVNKARMEENLPPISQKKQPLTDMIQDAVIKQSKETADLNISKNSDIVR